jgi:hypothetical protein
MTCSRHALGRRMQGCLLRPHPGVPAGGASTMKPASNPERFTQRRCRFAVPVNTGAVPQEHRRSYTCGARRTSDAMYARASGGA